jgi:hypothetical protein
MFEFLSTVRADRIAMVATDTNQLLASLIPLALCLAICPHCFFSKARTKPPAAIHTASFILLPDTNPLITFHSTELFVLKNDFDGK